MSESAVSLLRDAFCFYFYREISNIHHFEGFERHFGQKRAKKTGTIMNTKPWQSGQFFEHEPFAEFRPRTQSDSNYGTQTVYTP